MSDAVKQPVKDFIMSEFLPGEDPNALSPTPVAPHHPPRDHLDTIADIAHLILVKNPKASHDAA
jgi:hypothetical protein